MKWEMDVEEIESVLEKIWDLHDKLSDAIHSVSREHFLNSIKNLTNKSGEFYVHKKMKPEDDDLGQKPGSGFVFVKEFRVEEDESAVQEAKSLYTIRTALENLEDQLEFFHTVQSQQRAERDGAIARLEQSRIILAMRLAKHQGINYKVIEEAQALVGNVQDASRFIASESLYDSKNHPSSESIEPKKTTRHNIILNFLYSGFNFISKSIKLDNTVGILGNAALFTLSMLALMHLNQISYKEKYTFDLTRMEDPSAFTRRMRKNSQMQESLSSDRITQLDVMLARG